MGTLKDELIDIVSNMPDNLVVDDVMYRLYVLDKIKKGQQAILNNKVFTHEELQKEVLSW
jgi:hypothetical protein